MHRPRKIHRRGWDTAFGQALCDIPYFSPRWQTTTLQGSLLSRCIDFFLLLTSVAHFSSRPWRVEMCWGGSWSAPISKHRGGKLGRSLVFRLEGLMPHLLFLTTQREFRKGWWEAWSMVLAVSWILVILSSTKKRHALWPFSPVIANSRSGTDRKDKRIASPSSVDGPHLKEKERKT